MDELRKNQTVVIETKNKLLLNGLTLDYSKDRVMVLISSDSVEKAKKLNELDDIVVTIQTHLGSKKMKSTIISAINESNCIVVENNPAFPVNQKREFVRVVVDVAFMLYYKKKDLLVMCNAVNLSAGGIAFKTDIEKFDLEDDVIIQFSSDDFGKDLHLKAKIINVHENNYIAKFYDLNSYDEDCIVKFVFKQIAKK